ncbi:MAG: DUF3486 family protein [Pseudomonadota bacterium]
MASARRGRGRLSKIELLPEACQPVIAWARDELRRRDRTQTDIYQEFVSKLDEIRREHRGEMEFDTPSFSSFNRRSIKLADLFQRMDQTREIAAALAKSFEAKDSDELTIIAASAIKSLIFELVTEGGESGFNPKEAMQLAAALKSANQAEGVSTARRLKSEEAFKEQVGEAVDKVKAVKGITAETAEQIKAQILGVALDQPEAESAA